MLKMQRLTVSPDGPIPCDVAIVGEAPNTEELKQGRGFVGPSGRMLWDLLARVGLYRGRVYVSNLSKVQCGDEDWRKMTDEQLAALRLDLTTELALTAPSVVLAVGARAAQALSPDFLDMRTHHGIPLQGPGYLVLPIWHPAAALHAHSNEENPLVKTAWDIQQYAKRAEWAVWRERRAEYVRCEQFEQHDPATVALDTEGSVREPWCLTYAFDGMAGIIHSSNVARLAAFACWLNGRTVVLHNAIHDIPVLRALGVTIAPGCLHDTMQQAYTAQVEPQALKALAARHLGVVTPDFETLVEPYWRDAVMGIAAGLVEAGTTYETHTAKGRLRKKPKVVRTEAVKPLWRARNNAKLLSTRLDTLAPAMNLDLLPLDVAEDYAIKDAVLTLQLYPLLPEQSSTKLDLAVLPIFEQMAATGLRVNHEYLAEELAGLETSTRQSLAECARLADNAEFNPGSGDMVSEWCRQEFRRSGKCGLARQTRSRTRESVDDEALASIAMDHALIPAVQRYRHLQKERSELRGLVGIGRLHPNWRLSRVLSGRVATTKPNVLAFSPAVRACLVADPGHELMALDYSQIEPRLAAHITQDPKLLAIFRDGRDLYRETAAVLFGVQPGAVSKVQRQATKVVTLGTLYGIRDSRLARTLVAWGCVDDHGHPLYSVEACGDLLYRWFDTYTGVRDYLAQLAKITRLTGVATTHITNRERMVPAVWLTGQMWPNAKLREEAERQTFNHEIQGTAADIIKRAQVRIAGVRACREAVPLLQIHDELVFQIPLGRRELAEPIAAAMVADAGMLSVPLVAEAKFGQSWASLKG